VNELTWFQEPSPVARKVLGTQVHFKKEVENLRELRKALLEHKHIAPFLAIISVGTEFNILSKLADMNLQEFLDGRHAEFDILPDALMMAFSNLASALAFLHGGIEIPGRGCVFCCHMDLKPDNILVYQNKEYPVGIWKISDFGISTIKRSEIEQEEKSKAADNLLQVPSALGDLKGRLTPLTGHTSAKRPRGTWQAPEVEMSSGKVVGRESDVPICAFEVGGPTELARLGRQRGKTSGGDSYDDKNGDCFWWETETKDKVLNPHIEGWVEALPDWKGHDVDFLLNCKSLIFSALKITRNERIKAREFCRALEGIRLKQPKIPRIQINGSKSSSVISGEYTSNAAPESVHLIASQRQPEINFTFTDTTNGDIGSTPQLQDVPLSPPAVTPLRPPGPVASLMTESSLENSSFLASKQDDKGKGKEMIEESLRGTDDIRNISATPQPGNYSENERQGVGELSKMVTSLGVLPEGAPMLQCSTPSPEISLADTVNPPDPAPTTISQDLPLRSTAVPKPRRSQTEPATGSPVPLARPIVDHNSRSAPIGPGNLTLGPASRFSPTSRMNSMASARSSANNSSVFSGSDSGRATKKIKFSPPNLKPVIQTVIPPSCEIIAFLSNDVICVYPINNLHDNITRLVPPPGFKWLSASISGVHILARGQQMSTKETMVGRPSFS
jgi:hypothetical protein